jgi:hypothetical protein
MFRNEYWHSSEIKWQRFYLEEIVDRTVKTNVTLSNKHDNGNSSISIATAIDNPDIKRLVSIIVIHLSKGYRNL